MKYQLAEHISLTQVDDEAVLLDLNVGAYFGLNHIGAQFLNALKENQTVEQAVLTICEQYQMPPSTVQSDLQALLDQLLEQKLIKAKP